MDFTEKKAEKAVGDWLRRADQHTSTTTETIDDVMPITYVISLINCFEHLQSFYVILYM